MVNIKEPRDAGAIPAPATKIKSDAGVAQWLEQWNHNPCVGGSNPSVGIKNFWSRGVAWKTCFPVTEEITGSNPVATAKNRPEGAIFGLS